MLVAQTLWQHPNTCIQYFLVPRFYFYFPFFLPSTLLDAVSNLLNLKIDSGVGHLGDGNV